MGIEGPLLLILILFVNSVARGEAGITPSDDIDINWSFKRSSFPKGFIFGTATSAYQYEGAWNTSGKGPSNWDNFTQTYPEMVKGGCNGENADDFYKLYPDDFKHMQDIGFDAVRISFSWSRILPNGRVNGGRGINRAGLEYYHKLINESLDKGQEPFVTLFHFDTPQALEDEYKGFLDRRIVEDFHDYAKLCFEEFGDKVKYWITMNEPWSFCAMGYAHGAWPPGRCSKGLLKSGNSDDLYRVGRAFNSQNSFSTSCPVPGDSATEPYNVTNHLLLAHASAVRLYRSINQIGGQIGIILYVQWMLPFDTQSQKDIDAAGRALDFMYGWFMDPLTNGSYPASMVKLVGERLPNFTGNESEMVKGSFDFVGLNYYTAGFVKDVSPCQRLIPPYLTSYLTDSCTSTSAVNITGDQIGPQAGSDWLYIYPQGIGDLLNHTMHKYQNPVIYVTENGVDKVGVDNIQHDSMRIKYHNDHLRVINSLVSLIGVKTVDVRGYFVWSFLDNFEWADGYTVRFGLVYVDYFNETLTRLWKDSAWWFQRALAE